MTVSDISKADKASRLRASLMAAMAAILIVSAVVGFDDGSSGAITALCASSGLGAR